MRISENAVAAEILVHLAWEAQQSLHERLDGVHVSDVTLCPRKAWYRLHGRPQVYSPDDKLLFMAGSGHHQMIQDISRVAGSLAVEVEVPCRLVKPGLTVHGTVDLILSDPDAGEVVCEIKTTRASANKAVEQSAHYLEQVASYCLILGVSHARLYILHLLGDYRENRTPQMRCWELEFSKRDLERWEAEMVRRHGLIVSDSPPHPYEAYSWECGYCCYSQKKGGPCPGGGLRVPFFINDLMPERIPLTLME